MNKIVSSVVIKNDSDKILAVKINKEKEGGVWVPPGGKLEQEETARECAIREAKEELDIKVKISKLIGISEVKHGNDHWIFLYYLGELISGNPTPQEEGKTLEAKYVSAEELNYAENIKWIE